MVKKTLGERIRELRELEDCSVRELARKLDLSAAFLSDVELGRRHPSEEVLVRLAKALGTTAAHLKEHDARLPVQQLKRLAASNPAMGFALRRMVSDGVSPEDLMAFLEGHERKGKKP